MTRFTTAARRLGVFVFALAFAAAGLAAPARAHADDIKTVPLLLIVVGFAGDGTSGSAVGYDAGYDWGASIFGEADSLASYYTDMSGGSFTFAPVAETCAYDGRTVTNKADRADDGVVHVTLDEAHGAWGLVNEDSKIAQEFGDVVLDAYRAASAYINYSDYDANGDGLITIDELAVGICVAGDDASSYSDPGRSDVPLLWPHAGYLAHNGTENEIVDGVQFSAYIAIAEYLRYDDGAGKVYQEPVGILSHELGHYLGLPDLYPLDSEGGEGAAGPWSAYRVGPLSLMDNGGWAGVGSGDSWRYRATAYDAWSRYVLNWELPLIVTESGDYEVRSQLSDAGYRSLLIPTSDPDVYYLVENRQPEGYDEGLATSFAESPEGGIVIWLVDKQSYRLYAASNEVNNSTHHPSVMELFFEKDAASAYTTAWDEGAPDVEEPFYSALSLREDLGSSSVSVELPLYGDESGSDLPSRRVESNIAVSVPVASAREMTVHVDMGDTSIANAAVAYADDPLDEASAPFGISPAARLACAALIAETGADVAFLDAASVKAPLAKGEIAYSDVAAALPCDSTIQCFDLRGDQIVELVERSYANYASCLSMRALGVDARSRAGALTYFGGITCTIGSNGGGAAQVIDASILGSPVKDDQLYRVAITRGFAQSTPLLRSSNPELEVLYGSPADALRSFVLHGDWESEARSLAGTQSYAAPSPQPGGSSEAVRGNPGIAQAMGIPVVPIALVLVAFAVVLAGVFFTVRSRR